MTYHVGQWVTIDDGDDMVDITADKAYAIVRVMGASIEIIDDAHDTHAINNNFVTLAQVRANPHGQRITTPQGTFAAQYQHDPYEVQAVDEEDSYEESKANARVTSTGLFDKGDVLVYLDGTPTLTTLTVVYCTATAVCFEETYSMPFNPIEFRRECQ